MPLLVCFAVGGQPPGDGANASTHIRTQLAMQELAGLRVGSGTASSRGPGWRPATQRDAVPGAANLAVSSWIIGDSPDPLQNPARNESLQMYADTKVFLGSGGFAAMQAAYVDVESRAPFDRAGAKISALAGYAGAHAVGPGGLVCYYGAQPHTIYEGLGYAQVVQITLRAKERPDFYDLHQERNEFANLLQAFFAAPNSQQAGMQFRSCIGIPGGMASPLFAVVQEQNVGLELVRGVGGDPMSFNTVYIYDTNHFPFHRAETYLQFEGSPANLKSVQEEAGHIPPTRCAGDQH